MNYDDSDRMIWFKFTLFVIAIILGFGNALRAEDSLYDLQLGYSGWINSQSGAAYSASREYSGWVTSNGAIWREDRSYAGWINKQSGAIYSADGEYVGFVAQKKKFRKEDDE